MTIYTHIKPDLDAIASVWAWIRFVLGRGIEDMLSSVKFVPANWNGAEIGPGDVALDIEAGGKGLKGHKRTMIDGSVRVMSAFASVIEKVADPGLSKALFPLTEFVEEQDSTGDGIFGIISEQGWLRDDGTPVGRKDVPASLWLCNLASLRTIYERIYGEDIKVFVEMAKILDAIYEAALEREGAQAEAIKARWYQQVALIENAKSKMTNGLLFEAGAKVVVFIDGFNLGAVRNSEETFNLGTIVRPIIEECASDEIQSWFFHAAGFLAARGTYKAPALTPSRVPAAWLAEAISKAIGRCGEPLIMPMTPTI